MIDAALSLALGKQETLVVPPQVVSACSGALQRIRSQRLDVHSVGVTSVLPKEGRTIVSAGLALALVALGQRTVLLDLDLGEDAAVEARSSLAGRGMGGGPGQAHALSTGDELVDRIDWVTSQLGVLGRERLADLGSAIVAEAALPGLLAGLRDRDVFVVADLPPLRGRDVMTGMVGSFDAVVLVVLAGSTPLDSVRSEANLLPAAPFILLNRVGSAVPRWLRFSGGT